MQHSDRTQLAALDAAIAALRRRMLPPTRECDLLADQLGTVRDRVAKAMALAEEKRIRLYGNGRR
jgi:hypothetical protein